MDKHYNLNKEEKKHLSDLLVKWIDEDSKVYDLYVTIQKEITQEMQKLIIEKLEITPEVLTFLNKYCCDTSNIYYYTEDTSKYRIVTDPARDFNYMTLPIVNTAVVNCYSWYARNCFRDNYSVEIRDTFEKVFKKYKDEVIKRKNKFINIYNDTMDIISGYNKATQYLETFGFVDSINKYLNSIMQSVAKNPLTVVTKDKLEQYNNYLEQRKKDVK